MTSNLPVPCSLNTSTCIPSQSHCTRWCMNNRMLPILLSRSHLNLTKQLGFLTFEVYVQATEFQLNALQRFAQRFMVMTDFRFPTGTKWQRKVRVSFLPVVVWPNSIHPQDNFFTIIILKQINNMQHELI